jgi:hypothetical protein
MTVVISEAIWRAKDNNIDMSNYRKFNDIPASRHDEESLAGWLYYCGPLSEIPSHLRTGLILEAAAYWDRDALFELSQENTPNYENLVMVALSNGSERVRKINKEHFTESLLVRVCCEEPRCMNLIDWDLGFKEFLTDSAIEVIASNSIFNYLALLRIKNFDESKISEEFIKLAIKNDLNNLLMLLGCDKNHLITQVLSEGAWPEFSKQDVEHFSKLGLDASAPPDSVEKALLFLCASEQSHTTFLYSMSINSFPLDSVITAALKIKNGLDFLFGHYSEDELRPHMRKHHPIRGRMLENELGM